MRKALVENFMMIYPKVVYISSGRKKLYKDRKQKNQMTIKAHRQDV